MKWVLKNGNRYFMRMTAFGPQSTAKIAEAMVYPTKEDAIFSPAHSHSDWTVTLAPTPAQEVGDEG